MRLLRSPAGSALADGTRGGIAFADQRRHRTQPALLLVDPEQRGDGAGERHRVALAGHGGGKFRRFAGGGDQRGGIGLGEGDDRAVSSSGSARASSRRQLGRRAVGARGALIVMP